jgi:hypothetical protein
MVAANITIPKQVLKLSLWLLNQKEGRAGGKKFIVEAVLFLPKDFFGLESKKGASVGKCG